MSGDHEHPSKPSQRTFVWLATAGLLALAAACYVYATEHQNHIVQALMWALILACPLMHFFGHGHGHGHGHGGHRHGGEPKDRK